MRKVKFISDGFPDEGHIISALQIAKGKVGEMSIGDVKYFGVGSLQTILKIQDNNDILLVMTDTDTLKKDNTTETK